jgi:Peptidase M50B-like
VHRFFQCLLIFSVLLLSWLGMMVVHEFGHVLAAWASGGTVAKVVLHPFEFSRTDLAENPHPLFVAWGGASEGILMPLCFLWIAKWKRFSTFYIFQFFADFCLVVNGIYLGAVSFMNAADAGDLMRHGTPHWVLVLFGVATVPLGFFLWNGLGPHYGVGRAGGQVSRRDAIVTFILLLAVIVMEVVVGSR